MNWLLVSLGLVITFLYTAETTLFWKCFVALFWLLGAGLMVSGTQAGVIGFWIVNAFVGIGIICYLKYHGLYSGE